MNRWSPVLLAALLLLPATGVVEGQAVPGTWAVRVPGSPEGSGRPLPTFGLGASLGRLRIDTDGGYRWAGQAGRIIQVTPWFARDGIAYYAVEHPQFGGYVFHLRAETDQLVFLLPEGGFVAYGYRESAAEPVTPVEPTTPTEPTKPAEPATPTEPTKPAEPTPPTKPADDPLGLGGSWAGTRQPPTPTQPTPPAPEPTAPTPPAAPTPPTKPADDPLGLGGSWAGSTRPAAVPALVRLELAPAELVLAPGASVDIRVIGHYDDGSHHPLPVHFTATGGAVTPEGRFTAGPAAGSATVTAREPATGLSALVRIRIKAPEPTLF